MIDERNQAVVMPIVLLNSGSHLEAVEAVAKASLESYRLASSRDPEKWGYWIENEEGKSVRRAKEKDFLKLVSRLEHNSDVKVGEARAIAYSPVSYDEMDKNIRRCQVNGTDFDRASRDVTDSPTIVLNGGLGMSTGKSGAQAAHALLAWWRALPESRQVSYADTAVNIIELDTDEFNTLAAALTNSNLVIHDAGHTEIESGSATAFVVEA